MPGFKKLLANQFKYQLQLHAKGKDMFVAKIKKLLLGKNDDVA